MGAGVEQPAAAGRDPAIGSLFVRFRGLEGTGDGREVAAAEGVVARAAGVEVTDAKSSPKAALSPLPG